VIQQVIRCDICGSQKRQTNHWFIAREESGELRISGWNSLYLQSPETKHLCGETCAHRLISQFLMRLGDVATQPAAEKSETEPAAETEISAPAECALLRPQYCKPGTQSSPGSRDCVRLERSRSCAGRRTS